MWSYMVRGTSSDILIGYFSISLKSRHPIRLFTFSKQIYPNKPAHVQPYPRFYLDYDGYTTPVACTFPSGSVKVSLLKSALYRFLVLGRAASFLRFRFPSFNGSGRTLVADSLI
jgi:hypothetical protein